MSSFSKRNRDELNENADNSSPPPVRSGGDADPVRKTRRRERAPLSYTSGQSQEETVSEDEDFYPGTNKTSKSRGRRSVSKRKNNMDVVSDSDELVSDSDPEHDLETGIILWIDLENFMNHRKMHVKFNSHLNFVTGRNGSGKSAVVTGLMLAFAGKPKDTGRIGRGGGETGLAGLIRIGSNGPARIQVCLLNTGSDAYEAETYGNKIIIERTIRKSSSGVTSSYRVLSAAKREVSTDKKVIDKILSSFNIHIDNPCCVLTQEQSKKFIQGSSTDKYEFFMKATGLHKMLEDIKNTETKVEDTKIQLNNSEKQLTSLQAEVKTKKMEMKSLMELSDLDNKINLCDAKAYWIDVYDERSLLSELEKKFHEAQQNIDDAKEVLRIHKDQQGESSRVEEMTAAVELLTEQINSLQTECTSIQDEYKNAQTSVTQQANNIRRLKERKVEYTQQLQKAQAKLEEIRAKALECAEGREVEIMASIESANKQAEEAKEREHEQRDFILDKRNLLASISDESKQWEAREKQMKDEIKRLQSDIQKLKHSDSTAIDRRLYALGGQRMIDAYKLIQSDPSIRSAVVGPIGSLVQIKPDFKKFEFAVETTFGGTSTAFINLTNKQSIANKVLDLFRKKGLTFEIINQPYSEKYTVPLIEGSTVLDAIELPKEPFENQLFNCIIDRLKIEKRILIDREEDARRYVYTARGGAEEYRDRHIRDMICENATVVAWRAGARSSIPQKRALKRGYLAKDSSQAIQIKEEELAGKESDLREFQSRPSSNDKIQQIKMQIGKATNMKTNFSNQVKEAMRVKSNLSSELQDLQETQDLDTTQFEAEETELKDAIKEASQRIEDAEQLHAETRKEVQVKKAAKESKENEQSKLEEQLNDHRIGLNEAIQGVSSHKAKQRKLEDSLDKCLQIAELRAEKVASQKLNIEKVEDIAREKTAEKVDNWDGEALLLTRNDNKKRLEAEARKLKDQREKGRREQGLSGVTLDIATERYTRAKQMRNSLHEKRVTLINDRENFLKDLQTRKDSFKQHRKHNASVVNENFDRYMNDKGFEGTCKINHNKDGFSGTLELHTNVTQDTEGEGLCTDVRQLSGGERSFTTLALLLALGHVMDTPFRVMDEYDVFLDSIARKVTLNQLVEHAESARQAKRQFIIVTPHSTSSIKSSPKVKIHKMQDPERHSASGLQQQTLQDFERN